MPRSSRVSKIAGFCLLSASLALLAGCSTSFGPSDSAPLKSTPVGKIQGSIYGGRSVIVGSKIFILQASTTGYGATTAFPATAPTTAFTPGTQLTGPGTSTSLLQNYDAGDGFPPTQDSNTADETFGDYYVTSDANGNFTLDNEYDCTPGTVVYLYANGGNALGTGSTSDNNPQIGMMAVLGTCPATGTMAGSLPGYIYMNEVSTVAAAYALAGYAYDPLNIGSSGTTLGAQGLANAAANAGQMYNLFVMPNPTITTLNGARTTTPAGNGVVPQATINTLGNILVSCINSNNNQSTTSSTQCNSLRAWATNDGTTGTVEAANYVGTYPADEAPDTAFAMINIAKHPGNNAYNLCTLQGSGPAAVYTPAITCVAATAAVKTSVPNDWTVNISYTGGGLINNSYLSPKDLAIDGSGNVWITDFSADLVSEFNYLGAPLTSVATGASYTLTKSAAFSSTTHVATYTGTFATGASNGLAGTRFVVSGFATAAENGTFYCTASTATTISLTNPAATASTHAGTATVQTGGYPTGIGPISVAIDGSGNAWTTNFFGSSLSEITPAGVSSTLTTLGGTSPPALNEPDDLEFDGSGNMFIANAGATTIIKATGAAAYTTATTSGQNSISFPDAIALEAGTAGGVWVASESTDKASYFTNALATSAVATTGTGTAFAPFDIAVDNGTNAWVTILDSAAQGYLYSISTAGTLSSKYSPGNYNYYINEYDGLAIDGNNNTWAMDADIGMIYQVSNGGTTLSPQYGFEIPGNIAGHTSAGSSGVTVAGNSLVVDGSGNLWYQASNGTLREMIGAAAPVVTPVQVGAATNKLGARP